MYNGCRTVVVYSTFTIATAEGFLSHDVPILLNILCSLIAGLCSVSIGTFKCVMSRVKCVLCELCHYLCQGGYVIVVVCLSVYLFVC